MSFHRPCAFALVLATLTCCAHREEAPIEPAPEPLAAYHAGTGEAGMQRNTLPATDLLSAIAPGPAERKVKSGEAVGKYRKPGSERPWALVFEGMDEGRAHFSEGEAFPDKTIHRSKQYLHGPGSEPLIIDGVRILVHRVTRDAVWMTVTPN